MNEEEVKAEVRKAVELPPLDAEYERLSILCDYDSDRNKHQVACRDRQLLAALTNNAALQDRVKELEAERETNDQHSFHRGFDEGRECGHSEAAPAGVSFHSSDGMIMCVNDRADAAEAERDALKAADAGNLTQNQLRLIAEVSNPNLAPAVLKVNILRHWSTEKIIEFSQWLNKYSQPNPNPPKPHSPCA